MGWGWGGHTGGVMTPPRGPGPGRLHALTILLSSFLLFQVQPLLSKGILPRFGGGPEVWATCLVFFQAALFVGYAVAFLSERFLGGGLRVAVHVGLVAAACAFLPIGPETAWKPESGEAPALRVLLLLGSKAGLPFVLLASTGPLVQAWFSRSYPGRSPYRLYALSNVGSLAALLSYPFLVEPRWGLQAQSRFWTAAFGVFCGLSVAAALLQARLPAPAAEATETEEAAPSRLRVGFWILLPATASGMLMATSSQLSQDIAVIPFLWVLPLAAYLLSFILTFERPASYSPRVFAPLTIALLLASVVFYILAAPPPWIVLLQIGTTLGFLFCICMICHGELALLKPAPRFLTTFYLAVSAGGALGGACVSLLAPRLFSTYLEGKIGMLLAYLAAWAMLAWIHRGAVRAHPNRAALGLAAAVVGAVFLSAVFTSSGKRLEAARNFYGVVTVEEIPAGRGQPRATRDMASGRILHGRQVLDESRRRTPTTYYVPESGVGRALGTYRSRKDLRVGVVGLGAGTLAAYGTDPTQGFRFYEINPEVIRLARSRFTFLADCPARVEVVEGDARLSLEREPPQGFHLLALDAFSGDTVPTHLLTLEAMRGYLRHLDPEGTIAVHVSNRYLDLEPVVRGGAHRLGMGALTIEHQPPEGPEAQPSLWILCTRNAPALQEWAAYAAKTVDAREIVWTDDESALFPIFRTGRRR